MSTHSPFTSIDPLSLNQILSRQPILLLDIRPHAAFSSARLPRALSLSLPSTLLKRPLFSLDRLSAMLPSASTQARFSSWPSASAILVYDADSSSIPESSNIYGLLRKFKNHGFSGDLYWLQGGFQAVLRDCKSLVDSDPPSPQIEDEEDDQLKLPNVLRTRQLPMSAFSLSSTAASGACSSRLDPPSMSSVPSRPPINPFFDTIRQNVELSHGITERIPLRLPLHVRRRITDLPFPWLQDIARRAAPRPPTHLSDSSESEDEPNDVPDAADIEEGSEALAMQFYRIELAEQRRLMGVMEHHSMESGTLAVEGETQACVKFPFSITAGVEKGAKNRYRHIWPFEHARVRLRRQQDSSDDDYVNASYVQPLGTRKRYIATQGPLPATFTDFWTLCWEQNVHIIVMLTREVEGATVKCGKYWHEGTYGTIQLRLIATTGAPVTTEEERSFFATRPKPTNDRQPTTVKRVFEMTNSAFPDAPARRVTQLQYLGWPDMNVPDDPKGLLGLIADVNQAYREAGVMDEPEVDDVELGEWDERTGVAKRSLGQNSPVLLHCSAGVGRTGGFIAVDAVLDAVRREIIKKRMDEQAMEVDDVHPHSPGDSLINAGLVVPISVSATNNQAESSSCGEDEDLVVHVPFVCHDPIKPHHTPGPANIHDTDNDSKKPHWGGSTRKWAEFVSDETGIGRPASEWWPSRSGSPPNESSGSSSGGPSLFGSDDSAFEWGYGSRRMPIAADASSLATSVSGSGATSSRHVCPPPPYSSKLNVAPGSASRSGSEHRPRVFSAPPGRPLELRPGKTSSSPLPKRPSTLGSSPPFASSSALWLPDTTTSAFPLRRKEPALKATMTSSPMPMSLLSPALRNGFSLQSECSSAFDVPSRSLSPSLATEGSLPFVDNGNLSTTGNSNPSAKSSPLFNLGDRATTVDYKEPRPLHKDSSPLPLTDYEEPIWQVVQDMREQRMSLCQSLRQYVFVHAAIIEGALAVVDEEQEGSGRPRSMGKASTHPAIAREPATPVTRPHVVNGADTNPQPRPISKGKRVASPTELLKEDKSGDVALTKRPSIKRSRHSAGRAQAAAMPMPTRPK